MSHDVLVPPERLERWFAGFVARNGPVAEIRSTARATVVRTVRDGTAELDNVSVTVQTAAELVRELLGCGTAAVVLVRRGGYSIARASYSGAAHAVTASKTGSRYVQGRTAAGGQSQQRFARRRAEQAAALSGAAAAAARTVLGDDPAPVDLLVTGGDQQLVAEVLAERPLRRLSAARRSHVQVGEPRRRTIDEALRAARSIRIQVTNAADQPPG